MRRDGFVLRHGPREIADEKQPIEGAFLACSLWLADAFVLAGEIAKAQAVFDRVVRVANYLGLLAEEFDSGEGRQTGNFPQALTHIALINTAHNLSDASKPVEKPGAQRSKKRPALAAGVFSRVRNLRAQSLLVSDYHYSFSRLPDDPRVRGDHFLGLAGVSGCGSQP